MTPRDELREKVRAIISDAYYEARNARRTMEHAADAAADGVLDHLETLATREGLAIALRRARDVAMVRAGHAQALKDAE